MKIKELKIPCDRCFENVISQGTLYRKSYTFGSCTYCKKCYEEIQKDFEKDELTTITSRAYRRKLLETATRRFA